MRNAYSNGRNGVTASGYTVRLSKSSVLVFYFIGGFLTALPFLYEGLASPAVIDRINHLSRLQKLSMASYLFACGICLALICLHKISTIAIAEKTIKANR
jgi:hypothetical protein